MVIYLPLAGPWPICWPRNQGLAFAWAGLSSGAVATKPSPLVETSFLGHAPPIAHTRSLAQGLQSKNRQITRTQAIPLRTGSLKCTLRQICAEISESQQLRHGPARPCLTLHADSNAQHAQPGEGSVAGSALRRGPCRL